MQILQIDLKPIEPLAPFAAFRMILYIDGECFTSTISQLDVDRMVQRKIVHQVKGTRPKPGTDEMEEFEYPNQVDSAGVKYKSAVFHLSPYTEN